MSQVLPRFIFWVQNVFATSFLITFLCAAATVAQTQPSQETAKPSTATTTAVAAAPKSDSPTATVQEFYKAMRDKRFRDALMMTNLRSAVEKLTAAQMADLAPDFEPMATRVPEKIEINGEQISGTLASVFVKANDPLTSESKLDEVKMRRENNAWVVLTGDQEIETQAKLEGANYFFKLRMETRHADVEDTMKEIMKAELAYMLLHNSDYTDLQVLVKERLLSSDALDPDLMGYRFRSQLSADKKKYTVNAEPVQYGKTGKLSFLLTSGDAKTGFKTQREDRNGQPITSKNQ
jgi:hypothetical protein